jgi:sterol desaturase/sphingolipid hydroxylase (fatty acid hydroxylase superfamily)
MEKFGLIVGCIFAAFIVVESFLSARLNLDNYNRQDSLTNISIALLGAILNIFFKGVAFSYYEYLSAWSPWRMGNGWWEMLLLFLFTDLFYYLFHVLGHKSRFFWASHVIHHSSEKLNFTTALRSPITNAWFRFVFSSPIALMGFDPVMIIMMDTWVLFYTFFIHTELVGKLGWVEKVFNTPSHHRVHHASNPQYLDKNFGAVLIIWDKLFGTFQEENARPVYGLTKPLHTHNPLSVIFKEWMQMGRDIVRASSIREGVQYFLGKPGWSSQALSVRKLKCSPLSVMCRAVACMSLVLSVFATQAQHVDEWLREARQLEQQFKDHDALIKYEQVLQIQPQCMEALTRGSRMMCNTAGRSKDKKFKHGQAERAKAMALKAIQLDNRNKEAHLNYILSLGILAEMADSPREKLSNAKIIKHEAEYILTIDPEFAPAYYILGKWHYAIASLSRLETWVCQLLFGGVPPGASMQEAMRCYDKAIELWPEYILFYYSKGLTLHYLGDQKQTISILEKALKLKPVEPDDPGRIEKCRKLLEQAKRYS